MGYISQKLFLVQSAQSVQNAPTGAHSEEMTEGTQSTRIIRVDEPARGKRRRLHLTGLVVGLVAFAVMLALPPQGGMEATAWRVAAIAVLMAVWWLTEAVPVPVTALIPIAALPLFEVATFKAAASPYAHPLIFLFLAGFIIALAIVRSSSAASAPT